MSGGTICEIFVGPEAIVLQVRGVGAFRDRVVEITIQATNYRLRAGDLVWWTGNALRWEGRSLPLLVVLPESCDGR